MGWCIVYTPQAQQDADAARRWLTQSGAGPAALNRLRNIDTAISDLRQHPFRYAHGEQPNTRERSCGGGYRIIYRIEAQSRSDGDVIIVRIFGPGQDRSRL